MKDFETAPQDQIAACLSIFPLRAVHDNQSPPTMGQAALKQSPAQESALPDPTYYPTSDDMGEDALQTFVVELLRPLIARWLAHRGIQAFVGADQFIYWVQHRPTTSVAPDIYIMPGLSPDLVPKCWKLWEEGVVPSFALEVMAEDNTKDLVLSPRRYEELGVRELVIFDPHVEYRREPMRFRVYRRKAKLGLIEAEFTNGDRVRSLELGAYLRVLGKNYGQRLRIGTGPKGRDLFPTEAEEQANRAAQERVRVEQERLRAERERTKAEDERIKAEHERIKAEQERIKAEQERLKAEHEQERADKAEAEVARLRALIEKLQKH